MDSGIEEEELASLARVPCTGRDSAEEAQASLAQAPGLRTTGRDRMEEAPREKGCRSVAALAALVDGKARNWAPPVLVSWVGSRSACSRLDRGSVCSLVSGAAAASGESSWAQALSLLDRNDRFFHINISNVSWIIHIRFAHYSPDSFGISNPYEGSKSKLSKPDSGNPGKPSIPAGAS